jgi:hypothetical protein
VTATLERSPARTHRPLVVAVVLLAAVTVWVTRNLALTDWNPTLMVGVAAAEGPTLAYATDLLGDGVNNRLGKGHDGKFFFAQANDPWLNEPDVHAVTMDRPVYRSQRMLYPMLAGGFGLFGPWAVVWGLLAVSVLAIAAGTYATALVAQGMGASPWWGLAFGLNIGVVSELLVGGGGHLGFGLVMFGIAALQRGRFGWAAAALTGAALTREVMLVAVAGIALWVWKHHGFRVALPLALLPGVAVVAWALYVRAKIGWMTGLSEVEEIGWPLAGFIDAVELWPLRPVNFAIGVAMMALLVMFTLRFLRRPDTLVGAAAIGFVPLALLLTLQVWFNYFDITRAVSPVITAYVLLAFAVGRRPESAGMEPV